MARLRIYRVQDKYISFLHSRDIRVQYNKGQRRPYVGVVLLVGEFKYFVPMESPKRNHENIKSGKHIFRLDGGRYGLLGFNNMIPVCDEALIPVDIDAEPDPQYASLLRHQASFINNNRAAILEHASQTYYDVVNHQNGFLESISCDFKKLERACSQYNPNYVYKRTYGKVIK